MASTQVSFAPDSSAAQASSDRFSNDAESGLASQSLDVPRPKRIACVVCRKRKLRCDGIKPSCGTCSRLGHECAYDEVRRKSGPKRGYVKALEARLAQVETLLKDQNNHSEVGARQVPARHTATPRYASSHLPDVPLFADGDAIMDGAESLLGEQSKHGAEQYKHVPFSNSPVAGMQPWPLADVEAGVSWDMMSLGLEEALPTQDIIDSLNDIYFKNVHAGIPIVHRGRYYAGLSMAPNLRPPIALRYAMWTLAASVSDQYSNLQTHFYRRARKYLEESEMKGHGEGVISVTSSQAWILAGCYEFKMMYFPRAWMSTGRAVRLAQMMGLHRLDGVGLEVKQCLPIPKDWIEREERRRTFWMAFCLDRYASIGTGWPMIIEEKDILTNLPITEEAFELGQPAKTITIKEAMTSRGAALLSPFAGVCVMAALFGRNLIHLHRPTPDENDKDLNGGFWRRHRQMDDILLNIQTSLPSRFRLPAGINDPSVIFTNMNIHTSTICLHQSAIFKADKNRMPDSVSAESKIRCITAAVEIASIMKLVLHLDLSGMISFMAFCLYVAARVFVQYLKSRPGDEQVRASLQFLLSAMGHMKKKNPLTESFLVQLDVDLHGTLDSPDVINKFPYTIKKGLDEKPPEKSGNPIFPTPHPVQELPPEKLPFACTGSFTSTGSKVLSGQSSADLLGVDKYAELTPPNSNTSGQSPASMDLSDHTQNLTTPSPQTNSSSSSSYSPGYLKEYTTHRHVPIDLDEEPYQLPKDVLAWDMMRDFDGTDLGEILALSGAHGVLEHSLANPELGDLFAPDTV